MSPSGEQRGGPERRHASAPKARAERDAARAELIDWLSFVTADAHVLTRHPELCWQQAANRPAGSAVAKVTEARIGRGRGPAGPWLRWLNKPESSAAPVASVIHSLELVTALAASPDGTILAATDLWGEQVGLWDAISGRAIGRLRLDRMSFRPIVFSADGRWLLTWGPEELLAWEVRHLGRPRLLARDARAFPALAVTAAGTVLFRGAREDLLLMVDPREVSAIDSLPVEGSITGIRAPAGHAPTLIATSRGLSLFEEEPRAVRPLCAAEAATALGPAPPVAVTVDGSRAIVGTRTGAIEVWDTASGRRQTRLAGHPGEGPPEQRSFTTQIEGLRRSGHRVQIASPRRSAVTALATGTDPNLLASGGADGRIRIWELDRASPVTELAGHDVAVASLVFLSERRLLSGGGGPHLKIWSI